MAYFTILLPRLTYTFSTISYPKSILHQVQKQITKALIPRLGYSAKTPTDVVYGSISYGGIGWRDLYIEQGIAKINIIFCHVRANDNLAKIILINLEWTQLICGISEPILEKTTIKITYVRNWFIDIREFLQYIGGNITITENYQPHRILSQNDIFIMEKIIIHAKSKTTLETINRVRIWMKIATLAEITTADGMRIERKFWTGEQNKETTILWPHQTKPDTHAFILWQRFLSKTLLLDSETKATVK